MCCVLGKGSRLERRGHGDGKLCSDVWQFLTVKMVYIWLFVFISWKVCYSLDAVSRMRTSFFKCVAAHERLANAGLDHPYTTHLALPLFRLLVAGYCQWTAESSSRKFGWNKWHCGRLVFNAFSYLLQYNFTKTPCFFLRGGISQRQNVTPKRKKIGLVCIWWPERIGKLLIMQFPWNPGYFLSLQSAVSFCNPFQNYRLYYSIVWQTKQTDLRLCVI
jgi:hypothetical protein